MIGGISGAQGGSLTHSGLDSTVLVLRCHPFPCVVGRTPDRYLRSFWTMLQGVTPEQGTVAFSWGWSTVALFEERLFALLPPGCRSVSMALPFTIPFSSLSSQKAQEQVSGPLVAVTQDIMACLWLIHSLPISFHSSIIFSLHLESCHSLP